MSRSERREGSERNEDDKGAAGRIPSCKEEIQELKYKLAHLDEGDSMMGNSVIMDYRTGYPRPQSVVGCDEKKKARLRKTYEERIAKLQIECAEIEQWVEAIPES